eukprot:GHVU01021575.1.p1 GENE.GHVU01021575.1~~GHVU01021575.1.p1  ORF type:complete len:419 (+),score=33.96 GHVU01021575.1:153-1409(+)
MANAERTRVADAGASAEGSASAERLSASSSSSSSLSSAANPSQRPAVAGGSGGERLREDSQKATPRRGGSNDSNGGWLSPGDDYSSSSSCSRSRRRRERTMPGVTMPGGAAGHVSSGKVRTCQPYHPRHSQSKFEERVSGPSKTATGREASACGSKVLAVRGADGDRRPGAQLWAGESTREDVKAGSTSVKDDGRIQGEWEEIHPFGSPTANRPVERVSAFGGRTVSHRSAEIRSRSSAAGRPLLRHTSLTPTTRSHDFSSDVAAVASPVGVLELGRRLFEKVAVRASTASSTAASTTAEPLVGRAAWLVHCRRVRLPEQLLWLDDENGNPPDATCGGLQSRSFSRPSTLSAVSREEREAAHHHRPPGRALSKRSRTAIITRGGERCVSEWRTHDVFSRESASRTYAYIHTPALTHLL